MSIDSTNEYTLPSNPKDREKIKDNVEDIVNLMHQKAAIEGSIKEKEAAMKEELGIPPKIVKRLAKTLFKEQQAGNEFDKIQNEHEAFADSFEILFRGVPHPHDSGVVEEEEEVETWGRPSDEE